MVKTGWLRWRRLLASQQLRITLGEFLVDAACNRAGCAFCSGSLGPLAKAEIVSRFLVHPSIGDDYCAGYSRIADEFYEGATAFNKSRDCDRSAQANRGTGKRNLR
jgi:hypothetical protein